MSRKMSNLSLLTETETNVTNQKNYPPTRLLPLSCFQQTPESRVKTVSQSKTPLTFIIETSLGEKIPQGTQLSTPLQGSASAATSKVITVCLQVFTQYLTSSQPQTSTARRPRVKNFSKIKHQALNRPPEFSLFTTVAQQNWTYWGRVCQTLKDRHPLTRKTRVACPSLSSFKTFHSMAEAQTILTALWVLFLALELVEPVKQPPAMEHSKLKCDNCHGHLTVMKKVTLRRRIRLWWASDFRVKINRKLEVPLTACKVTTKTQRRADLAIKILFIRHKKSTSERMILAWTPVVKPLRMETWIFRSFYRMSP